MSKVSRIVFAIVQMVKNCLNCLNCQTKIKTCQAGWSKFLSLTAFLLITQADMFPEESTVVVEQMKELSQLLAKHLGSHCPHSLVLIR